MLEAPVISVLGQDPNRTHRINANSFQQNAITTVNGWQYVAFYTSNIQGGRKTVCHANLSRRQPVILENAAKTPRWETFTFEDYEQTADDGHNTISIGVCKGDGTIHIAFDHHCDLLRFRISKLDVTQDLVSGGWSTALFTKTQDSLPGIPANDLMREVTYPRFVNIDDDLLLTYRIGQAGLGSDVLYRYSSVTHEYKYLGQHLTGVSNSPYINGMDYRLARLHISWCYRNFITSQVSSSTNAHKQQAGPNGPENNYDLNYAYSDDLGETWKSSDGRTMALIGSKAEEGIESTIKPGHDGARVFEIPMGSGILNQEAQTADWIGGFWALNRENSGGAEKWILYHRDLAGKWTKTTVPSISQPTETGSRASICVDRNNNVYLILPGNSDSSLSIMKASKKEDYVNFGIIWRGDGFDGEPLVDVQRLEGSDCLSIFTRTDKKGDGTKDVVVLEFSLNL